MNTLSDFWSYLFICCCYGVVLGYIVWEHFRVKNKCQQTGAFMSMLRGIFYILVIALLWKIEANIQITKVVFSSYYGTPYPLTGTEPKPELMYPLTKSVLVNESAAIRVPLRKPESLGYVETQGDSEQATKKEGGK